MLVSPQAWGSDMTPKLHPILPDQLEHCVGALGYEIETLIDLKGVTEEYGKSGPAIVYHACLEAALLHARAVIEFLAGRNWDWPWSKRDLQPLHLLHGWPENDPWGLRRHLDLIDPHLSHLSLERGVLDVENDWSLEEIIDDVVAALRDFVDAMRAAGSPYTVTIAAAMRNAPRPPAISPTVQSRRGITFSTGDSKLTINGVEVDQ